MTWAAYWTQLLRSMISCRRMTCNNLAPKLFIRPSVAECRLRSHSFLQVCMSIERHMGPRNSRSPVTCKKHEMEHLHITSRVPQHTSTQKRTSHAHHSFSFSVPQHTSDKRVFRRPLAGCRYARIFRCLKVQYSTGTTLRLLFLEMWMLHYQATALPNQWSVNPWGGMSHRPAT